MDFDGFSHEPHWLKPRLRSEFIPHASHIPRDAVHGDLQTDHRLSGHVKSLLCFGVGKV